MVLIIIQAIFSTILTTANNKYYSTIDTKINCRYSFKNIYKFSEKHEIKLLIIKEEKCHK